MIDELADSCFVPFAVGGGVRSVEDARGLLRAGADKIVINSVAVENPSLIKDLVQQFGSQCVVVSIDVRNGNKVTIHSGKKETELDVVAFAKKVEELGAGEILLTSVERDGTMQGYDLDLIRKVAEAVKIPVIASGGAGNYDHFAQAIEKGAAAVAAGSMYHFSAQTPLKAKEYLKGKGVAVRL